MYLFPEVKYLLGMSKVPLGNIQDLVNHMTSERIEVLHLVVSYLLCNLRQRVYVFVLVHLFVSLSACFWIVCEHDTFQYWEIDFYLKMFKDIQTVLISS